MEKEKKMIDINDEKIDAVFNVMEGILKEKSIGMRDESPDASLLAVRNKQGEMVLLVKGSNAANVVSEYTNSMQFIADVDESLKESDEDGEDDLGINMELRELLERLEGEIDRLRKHFDEGTLPPSINEKIVSRMVRTFGEPAIDPDQREKIIESMNSLRDTFKKRSI